MKSQVLNMKGTKAKEIELPKIFSTKIRKDIIAKVLEAKKTSQPYGSLPIAGKQTTASGKLVHRRHVWRSGYGRGMSRIPRKITLRRGSQFNWIGAEVSSTRGGRRAHPPKSVSNKSLKINKKELEIAFRGAVAATANRSEVSKRYKTISSEEIKNLPIIVEKVDSKKTKDLLTLLKSALGEKIFKVSVRRKKIRSGKGKIRGRKYRTSAGALLVVGDKESVKTNIIETKKAKNLGINDLAKGGLGRIVIYTENAIKDMEGRK